MQKENTSIIEALERTIKKQTDDIERQKGVESELR